VVDPGRPSLDIGPLQERFPSDGALVAQLLAESDSFRSLCEDFILAKTTLIKLERFQREREAAKIAEYHQLVAELENEIAEALRCAKRT
jgi:crotonobetainyl-CoA:carnitine CoA-transferase CaiB-like acyl-CoA transferase